MITSSHRRHMLSPGRIILISIALAIFLGTWLLSLPMAQKEPVAFLDLLFTATSATCVTGLLTVPLTSFTFFGHAIILLLIQIGAIGLVTLTVFMMSLFVELGLNTQLMVGEVLEIGYWHRSRNIMGFIIGFTFFVELFGALCLYPMIEGNYTPAMKFFYAVFHAVASFGNAGMTLISSHNTTMLPGNPVFLTITAILVLMGGLGFIVWSEIGMYVRSFAQKRHFHWSLHSKIVASMTVAIISLTATVIISLEYLRLWPQKSGMTMVGESLFNAICCRSSGFTILDMQTIHFATIFFIMVVAFIGSSPGSTGGGIKTTTFALFLATIKAVIMRRSLVEIKGRSIAHDQIIKAMAILTLSLCWLTVTIFFLLISEQGWRFIDVAFEAVSAFANQGLSTGITASLSNTGKSIIILSMIIGRIGSLTLLLALKKPREKGDFHYPEERVIIG